MSIAAALAEALAPNPNRLCIVGRWLDTIPDDDHAAIHDAISMGKINTVRRLCAQDKDHPYTGSHAPWHKHFTADCSCHRTT